MTGLTRLIETKIGIGALAKLCTANVVGLVAVSAVYALVSTRQRVAC